MSSVRLRGIGVGTLRSYQLSRCQYDHCPTIDPQPVYTVGVAPSTEIMLCLSCLGELTEDEGDE